MFAVVLLNALVQRWLMVVRRRLAKEAALERRRAAREAAASAADGDPAEREREDQERLGSFGA